MTQVACPACGTGNRIGDRDPHAAKCGRCGAKLFAGAPSDVDDAAFAAHLKLSSMPVLVDVWAPWCGPCRIMAPAFAQAAQQFEPRVRFLKLNADQNSGASATRRSWHPGAHSLSPRQRNSSASRLDERRPARRMAEIARSLLSRPWRANHDYRPRRVRLCWHCRSCRPRTRDLGPSLLGASVCIRGIEHVSGRFHGLLPGGDGFKRLGFKPGILFK